MADRHIEFVHSEIRPQRIGKPELSVGKLPEQKIRQTPFATGSYTQICLLYTSPSPRDPL